MVTTNANFPAFTRFSPNLSEKSSIEITQDPVTRPGVGSDVDVKELFLITAYGEKVDLKKAKPADIMLFTGTDASKKKVGHVGMVLRNENGVIDFIHASSSKKHFGVTITRYNSSGYLKRFLRVINVL